MLLITIGYTMTIKRFSSFFFLLLCILALNASDDIILTNQHATIGTQEENDLELFTCRNSRGKSLFENLNYTQTKVGTETLKAWLKQPISNVTVLAQRQQIIQHLLAKNDVTIAITHLLEAYRNNEADFNAFGQEEDPLLQTALQEFYFKRSWFKTWNSSPALLNVGQVFNTVTLFAPVVEHAILHYVISNQLKKSLGLECCAHAHDHHHVHDHHHAPTGTSAASLLHNGYNIAHWSIHLLGLKTLAEHIKKNIDILAQLKLRVVAARTAIKSMHTLISIIHKDTDLANSPLLKAKLESIMHNMQCKKISLENTLKLLDSSSFAKSSMSILDIGNVLAAYHALNETKNEFNEMISLVAEMDAYASIAKLVTAYATSPVKFNFAHYAEQATPYIRITGFWNPFLDPTKATPNSIELGTAGFPRNAIATGLNTGGKSTALKAISLCVLLAQTFGIAPAQAMSFTPFKKIMTSLNITDNITCGHSLFAAELMRAQDTLDLLTASQKTDFVFITIDEIFRSTAYEKGQNLAYNFINKLGSHHNVISLFATHFTTITSLEKASPGNFKNYKVHIDKTTLPHRFLFEHGIGNADQALQIPHEFMHSELFA